MKATLGKGNKALGPTRSSITPDQTNNFTKKKDQTNKALQLMVSATERRSTETKQASKILNGAS